MAKIDEIKSEIDFLKDIFKISIAIIAAIITGLSKLYLDNSINILFYIGALISVIVSIILILVFKKIKKHIKELGEIDG
jgi:uncharacterized membrane protein YjjP (DUF1212 family)